MERLQKVIANRGYCSRRKAETLISEGKVIVDGERVTELGTKVKEGATIVINGETLAQEEKAYYLLYKPEGIVSTAEDEKGRKTVLDLLKTNERVYPVGRLDYDTSGIIILTNDGELTNKLLHPSTFIEKRYMAKINGVLTGYQIKQLKNGLNTEVIKTAPARVKVKRINKKTQTSIIDLTIHEGKYHQVKKMFEAIGFEVLSLKRETFAFLDLGALKKGDYRKLTFKEVKRLYSITNE